MARPSVISVKDISEAVTTLKDLNKPVNPYQVRTLIGKGSEAKIAYFLKGMDINIEYQDQDPVTDRLVNLLRPVVLELNEQYEETLTKGKSTLEEKLSKQTEKTDLATKQLKDVQTENEKLIKKIESLEQAIASGNEALVTKKAELLVSEQYNENLKHGLVTSENTLIEVRRSQEHQLSEHERIMGLLKNEHTETLQGYKKAVEQSNAGNEQYLSQIKAADKKLADQDKKLRSLEESLRASKSDASDLGKDLKDANKQIDDKDKTIVKQMATIESATKEKAKLDNVVSELKIDGQKHNSQQKEHLALVINNKRLNADVDKLSTEVKVLRSVVDKFSPSKNK